MEGNYPMHRSTFVGFLEATKSPTQTRCRSISKDNARLLAYLAELVETIGGFNVVAQRAEAQRLCEDYPWEELPITEVIVDEDNSHLCLVRLDKEAPVGSTLKVEAFFLALQARFERHPAFTIVVPVWIRIDEEQTRRVDIPLDSLEVDEDLGVLRLRF